MPLADFKQKFQKVEFDGGDFTVRGISLPDVAILIELHEGAISQIVEAAQGKADQFQNGDAAQIRDAVVDVVTSMTRESPVLVANLIAICADEENEMNAALHLPLTVQLDALTKIAALTFRDMAAVKKLVADVMTLVRGIVPAASPRRAKK